MDPFLLLGIAIAILVVFYFLFRRPIGGIRNPDEKEEGTEDDMFVFDPERDGISRLSRRKVTVKAPAQTINGARKRLVVEANPLPDLPNLQIPEGKGIEKLVVLVIDDRVRTRDTGEEVYEFDSPLMYTIEYTKEDAAATTTNDDGKPRLSIVTGYLAEEGWKFERLDTKVTPNPKTGGGTLEAKIKSLKPQDPKWVGVP